MRVAVRVWAVKSISSTSSGELRGTAELDDKHYTYSLHHYNLYSFKIQFCRFEQVYHTAKVYDNSQWCFWLECNSRAFESALEAQHFGCYDTLPGLYNT